MTGFMAICLGIMLLMITVLLAVACRRLSAIQDRLSKLYVPVPVQQPSPAETAELIGGLRAVAEGLAVLKDKIEEGAVQKATESYPDAPDGEERTAEEKAAEKRFNEGIYNILNYESRKGMGN